MSASSNPTRPVRVHVLSCVNTPNFGDRLGFHQLIDILPAHAEVTWGTQSPLSAVPRDTDLLVLGLGNSLYSKLLTRELLDCVASVPKAVGIFGTQYREALPADILAELVGRLDHWFARYEDDVRLYGQSRGNVSHLGDWLINAFPTSRGTIDRQMTVPPDILVRDLPLDRFIQFIQQHRRVFSTRLHPLLCALTSAEEVGYQEQRELPGSSLASGKFGSMLCDIFDRTFPENTFWRVERERVIAYKAKVRENTNALRSYLASACATA